MFKKPLNKTNIFDCSIIELPKIHNRAGNLTSISSLTKSSFPIKRVYYLYDIPGGEARGGHAHKDLHQLIIAASGSFDITINDGTNKKKINLNRPYYGLHIVPGIWREIVNISTGAICLVLASKEYTKDDYIRDFNLFLKRKEQKND